MDSRQDWTFSTELPLTLISSGLNFMPGGACWGKGLLCMCVYVSKIFCDGEKGMACFFSYSLSIKNKGFTKFVVNHTPVFKLSVADSLRT